MAERPKICIDRVLPTELMRPQRTMRAKGGERAISPIGKTWMNGSTLHVRFIGGTANEQATVREQSGWWAQVANLKFDFNNAANAEIRIAFDSNDGAWSYIGTDCRSIPVNQPTMNLGFLDGGTTAHEFGHAIALAHEHQNPRGGIQWNEQVVIQELAKSPNFWDEETVRHNVIRKYSIDQINGTDFDPDSIMLYFFPASGRSTVSPPKRMTFCRRSTSNSLPAPRCTRRPAGRQRPPSSSKSTQNAAPRHPSANSAKRICSALPPRPTAAIRSTRAVPPTSL